MVRTLIPALSLILILSLGLAAGAADARPPGRDAFAHPFSLFGTEPFWSTQIRGGRIRHHDDLHDLTVHARGPVVRGGRATWTSRSGALRVVIWRARCNDGMSDRIYRYQAEVHIDGGTLHGCADVAR